MSDRRRSVAVVAAAAGVLAIVAAGSYAARSFHADDGAGGPRVAASATALTPGSSAELIATATVLESADHGPELCVGSVDDSYPPQCRGPRLVGWDWSGVDGDTHAGGSIWGDYVIIGTYDADGTTFTPTRAPVTTDQYDGPRPAPYPLTDLTSPCDLPPGGWAPIDVEMTTGQTLNETIRRARELDDFTEVWVDQSTNPASDDPNQHEAELNDPRKLVLNVSVAGDIDAATADLRETWGGALCVSRADHSAREIDAIMRQVCQVDAMLGCGISAGVIHLDVTYDEGSLQRQFDDEFGAGVVRVCSALQPYPAG